MSWFFGGDQPSRRAPGAIDLDEVKPWMRTPGSVPGWEPGDDREAAKGRAWVEKCLRWCVAEFGEAAVRREFALPTADFLPTGLTGPGRHARIRQFVDRVGAVMGADTGALEVQLFTADEQDPAGLSGKRRTVGYYHRTGGRDVIELDRGHVDRLAALAALIAHALAHCARLRGEREPLWARHLEPSIRSAVHRTPAG
ncbi:hypothetical protein [Kitasatospora aureofaciens]|uniref:hypothetical protein n=1 Tax=Kitasatospora aureofaciens TaxID=1894 RepID=UPI0037C58E41